LNWKEVPNSSVIFDFEIRKSRFLPNLWDPRQAGLPSQKMLLDQFINMSRDSKSIRNQSSWCALFLENQIWSHATIAKIWNLWKSSKGIPILAGLRIIENQSVISAILKARISKCQKDWRHTTLAIGQEKKRCRIESIGPEHREQEFLVSLPIVPLLSVLLALQFLGKLLLRY